MARPKNLLSKTYNPGKAHWCDEHGRLECTKNKSRQRGRCHAAAVRGIDACTKHAGMTTEVAAARGEAKISAWNSFGDAAASVDQNLAVLGVLQMTWMRLAAYSELLRQQVTDTPPSASREGFDPEGGVAASGLIGFRYGAAGKDGHIYAQNEEIRALVALEAAERDRVVKYSKIAHDMGISTRMIELAEKWADIVAGRVSRILDELELTPGQEAKVPALLTAHLGAIEIGGPE